MKWAFSIQPKIKAAFLLAIICVAVLANMFWERRSISDLNDSFSSIYEDRLLPATYVFHLTDHLYQKRMILESYLNAEANLNIADDRKQIAVHNAAMDTLLREFETTYLVEGEDRVLHNFEQELATYNDMERRYLDHFEKGSTPETTEQDFENLFVAAKGELTQLSQIQLDVGKQLRDDSGRIAANTSLFTNMDALLIIVIGLIIQVLIFTSKTVTPKVPQQHEWN